MSRFKTVKEYAESILYGTSLDAKIVEAGDLHFETGNRLLKAPDFPGRPVELRKGGKAVFPELDRLHEAHVRGEVLHFFANHELLAIELMALVLLKFPDASPTFLKSIVATIQEEQSHLRLYVERMKELGVSFGDLPVSDYFWKCMSPMRSPMDFITQMSMTFEQANLDYALFYMKAVERVGDTKTSAILEKVYREEIGHVKNGVYWFNRLREQLPNESDWDAYLKLLPPPLNPNRAKGIGFNRESRRLAGLSETFIHELEVYSGSKGRPPILWLYNPCCDLEISRGRPGYTPTQVVQRMIQDLEHLPMYLALDKDVVLVDQKPRTEWIASLQKYGFLTPEFSIKKKPLEGSIRVKKIGGIEPWGWSPDTFEAFRPMRSRIVPVSGGNSAWCEKTLSSKSFSETGLGKFFSKAWSVAYLREWIASHPKSIEHFGGLENVGDSFRSWEAAKIRLQDLLGQEKLAMVKAPFGTAGNQIHLLRSFDELEGKLGGWIQNVLRDQGEVIVEVWLNKIYDLSIQIEILEDGNTIFEPRRFITGRQNEYRGTYLGKKLTGFEATHLRRIHELIASWKAFVSDLSKSLRALRYRGPAGIDALVWQDSDGSLKLKPLVELNPRWTMGRVALELEKRLKPGMRGLWAFIPVREIKKRGHLDAVSFADELAKRYPLQLAEVGGGELRIAQGIIPTNDPVRAQEVLSLLAVLPESRFSEFESLSFKF